jgi:hypothetical protein
VLRRLQSKSCSTDPKETLALIVHTDNLEKEITAGTTYFDCFRGVERRRTEIACVCFAGQIFSGTLFAYNSTYFFQQIGLSTVATYKVRYRLPPFPLLTMVNAQTDERRRYRHGIVCDPLKLVLLNATLWS